MLYVRGWWIETLWLLLSFCISQVKGFVNSEQVLWCYIFLKENGICANNIMFPFQNSPRVSRITRTLHSKTMPALPAFPETQRNYRDLGSITKLSAGNARNVRRIWWQFWNAHNDEKKLFNFMNFFHFVQCGKILYPWRAKHRYVNVTNKAYLKNERE